MDRTHRSASRRTAAWSAAPEWGQTYTYDGFGNRTAVTVTKGTAPSGSLTIDPLTNCITSPGFSYDANGNLTAMPGLALYYDYDNRLVLAAGTPPNPSYGYDAQNRRVMKGLLWGAYQGTADVSFIGVDGRRMGTYQVSWGQWYQGQPLPMTVQRISEDVHFGGRLVISQSQRVVTDRLGSVIKNDNEQLLYLPFGDERTTTAQNRHKFGTYFRDASGLDYAQNRYYSSSHGRFLTPDPYVAPRAARNPQSWNRYAYVHNDPVNFFHPKGTNEADPASYNSYDCEWNGEDWVCGWGGESGPLGPLPPVKGGGDEGGGAGGDEVEDETTAALQKAQGAAGFITNKQDWGKRCGQTLTAVGVSVTVLQEAAASVKIAAGNGSSTGVAELYANAAAPQATAAAAAQYQGITVGQYMAQNPGTTAMAELGGSRVFINTNWFNQIGTGSAVITMAHELLHNITGQTDPDLQRAMGLTGAGRDSRDITIRLLADCFL